MTPVQSYTNTRSANTVVQLSQDILYAAKTGAATATFQEQLNALTLAIQQAALNKDADKKAFWINLYNAYTQLLLKKNPERYTNRSRFFKDRQIAVCGQNFSLDDIEHGILRHSKIKWSLGYLQKLFPHKTERSLRVNKLDHRVHFALNCGAKSCPPLAFYHPEMIDMQLEAATGAYLMSEAAYDHTKNYVKLPALMSWFRHDFGGKKGTLRLLKKHDIIPVDGNPKIKFKQYDWTLSLNNYKNEIQ